MSGEPDLFCSSMKGLVMSTAPVSLSLAEFIAFNEQLAGLARAGVPLEAGLRDLAAESRGGLRSISVAVGERLEQGEPLDQVLAGQLKDWPAAYRGLIAVGLRTGHLADALQTVSGSARRIRGLRRAMLVASVYPLILLAVALLGGLLFIVPLIHWFQQTYEYLFWPEGAAPKAVFQLTDLFTAYWWLFAVGAGLVAVWWWWSGGLRSLRLAGPLGLFPGARRIVRDCEEGTAALLLGSLVERGVPLGDGLTYTADSLSDRTLSQDLRVWAGEIEAGSGARGVEKVGPETTGVGVLRRIVAEAPDARRLAEALGRRAGVLQDRVRLQMERMTVWLPVFLGVGIGGLIVVIYALGVFVPLRLFLNDLTWEAGR